VNVLSVVFFLLFYFTFLIMTKANPGPGVDGSKSIAEELKVNTMLMSSNLDCE